MDIIGLILPITRSWDPVQSTIRTRAEFSSRRHRVFRKRVRFGDAFCFRLTNSSEDQDAYELTKGELAIYGFEYVPGYDDAYISWINDNKLSWTVMAGGLGPDPLTEISARPMPQEPMYLLANLGTSPSYSHACVVLILFSQLPGISQSFGNVDVERLTFPAKMRVDWIRVYQPVGKKNIGCDPIDFPTKAYIDRYIEAYTNPNYTTWEDDFKQPTPKNRLVNGGC